MSNKKNISIKQNSNTSKKVFLVANQKNYKTNFLWLAGILILTFIAFSPALKNGFTNWDDNVYIGENTLITSLSGDNIKKIFNTDNQVALNYHPITILSFAVDYKLSGYNPKTYHTTNLIFHLLNTALVFWFIFLLSGKKIYVATIVALFFGIHPMHVESVAWIAERKDVLYVFFFMSSLICYYKYIHDEKNKFPLYIFTLILFLLSVLSKAMAVVLPLVLLLMDYYEKRKFDKYLILEKIPFFILSLFFGILASRIQSEGYGIANLETFTWLQRIEFASYGMVNYLSDLFIPINLSNFYPYPNPENKYLPILFYISPFIVIALFALFLLKVRKNSPARAGLFGFLFFCISIALVLQFISVGKVIMADRYSYLSYIGLLFPIGMGFDWLQNQEDKKYILLKKISIPVLILCAIICLTLTYQRTKVWKNSDTLWTDAISKYPNSEAYRSRGNYLANKKGIDIGQKNVGENEYDRALEDFNNSIKLFPYTAKVFTSRANIYALKKLFDLALKDYSKAIKLDKTDAQTFLNRGVTYGMMEQYDKEIADYDTALILNPNLTDAKRFRSYIETNTGKYEKAIVDLNELIKANPTNANDYFYRSFAYYKSGKNSEALADNTIAIQLNPNNNVNYFNRSFINKDLGKYKEALDNALKAQSMGYSVDPNYINELKAKL